MALKELKKGVMDQGRKDGTEGTHMEPLIDATAAVPHPGLLVVAGHHDAA